MSVYGIKRVLCSLPLNFIDFQEKETSMFRFDSFHLDLLKYQLDSNANTRKKIGFIYSATGYLPKLLSNQIFI